MYVYMYNCITLDLMSEMLKSQAGLIFSSLGALAASHMNGKEMWPQWQMSLVRQLHWHSLNPVKHHDTFNGSTLFNKDSFWKLEHTYGSYGGNIQHLKLAEGPGPLHNEDMQR